MDLNKIEFWENHYLNQIEFIIQQDRKKMMEGLRSKDKIKEDWIEVFKESANKNSDFARGAERIFFWLFNQFGIPNSSPIGSDLFFKTYNAFIHIDIKTAKFDNKSDYKGKLPLGKNQTNYTLKNKDFKVNLPTIYKYKNKMCLTYFINIIYEEIKDEINIRAIYLVSVPNGELNKIYKDDIYNASKNKGSAFRYKFSKKNRFELLKDNPLRIRLIYIDNKLNEEIIIGFKI